MARKTVITCSLNGGHDPKVSPAIPITPKEIAQATLEAEKAGAAMVHLHVRNPETGMGSMDLELYRETVARIRDLGCTAILNLTAGAGALYFPDEDEPSVAGPGTSLKNTTTRIRHVEELRPDMASMPMGTVNRGGPVYLNSEAFIAEALERLKAAGVKPELDILDTGQIIAAKALIERGLIVGRPVFQFCLGWPASAPATAEAMTYMKSLLPQNAVWQAFGRGLGAFPVAALSILLGGNVRIGLEDTSFLSEGVLASGNTQLIDEITRMMTLFGAEPATPSEARELLDLGPARG